MIAVKLFEFCVGIMTGGFSLSVCAGLCAALASVSSKLALEQSGVTIRQAVPCSWLSKQQCFFVSVFVHVVSPTH